MDGRLEANLLFLRSGATSILLVSLDLLYPGPTLRLALEKALDGLLSPTQIFLAATHTHNAPATDRTKPGLGIVNNQYLETLAEKLGSAARHLVTGYVQPVRVQAFKFSLNHSVNRRRPRIMRIQRGPRIESGIGMGPNPTAPKDELVTALVVGNGENVLAVVWNYACHPTAFPIDDVMSADYPGAVRLRLRGYLGSGNIPVLFFQGFSGETRPPGALRVRSVESLIKRIAWGPTFRKLDMAEYRAWVGSISGRIVEGLQTEGVDISGPIGAVRHLRPREEFVTDATAEGDVSFHGISIGTLRIIGVSGEVLSGYAAPMRMRCPSEFAMPVGCIDDVVGYLPTAEVLAEGGYEAGGYCPGFGLGHVTPGAPGAITAALHQLEEKLHLEAPSQLEPCTLDRTE